MKPLGVAKLDHGATGPSVAHEAKPRARREYQDVRFIHPPFWLKTPLEFVP